VIIRNSLRSRHHRHHHHHHHHHQQQQQQQRQQQIRHHQKNMLRVVAPATLAATLAASLACNRPSLSVLRVPVDPCAAQISEEDMRSDAGLGFDDVAVASLLALQAAYKEEYAVAKDAAKEAKAARRRERRASKALRDSTDSLEVDSAPGDGAPSRGSNGGGNDGIGNDDGGGGGGGGGGGAGNGGSEAGHSDGTGDGGDDGGQYRDGDGDGDDSVRDSRASIALGSDLGDIREEGDGAARGRRDRTSKAVIKADGTEETPEERRERKAEEKAVKAAARAEKEAARASKAKAKEAKEAKAAEKAAKAQKKAEEEARVAVRCCDAASCAPLCFLMLFLPRACSGNVAKKSALLAQAAANTVNTLSRTQTCPLTDTPLSLSLSLLCARVLSVLLVSCGVARMCLWLCALRMPCALTPLCTPCLNVPCTLCTLHPLRPLYTRLYLGRGAGTSAAREDQGPRRRRPEGPRTAGAARGPCTGRGRRGAGGGGCAQGG